MRSYGLLFLLILSGAVVLPIQAQAQSPEQTALQQRVEQLERLVKQLEQRVADLSKTGASQEAKQNEAAAPQERLNAMDQKLKLLEKEAAGAKAKTSPVVTAGREGFIVASADKSYRLKIGGFIQADGKTAYEDRSHLVNNNFNLRRARLMIDGTIGKYIDFRVAPDFGNGSVALYDAYADLKYQPYAVLRGGKFKVPMGLELLQSDTEGTFIERSLVTSLVPNRDEGFQVYGDIAGRMTYQVAVVNGGQDGANVDGDTNDGKDIVARIFATPFAKSGPAYFQGLGFGVAASSGQQNGAVLPSLKSSGGQATFFKYASTVAAAGRRLRYSPQMYYYNGPFGLLGEFVESSQELSIAAGPTHEVGNHAWQVTGSWLLTGESKSYKGVSPKKGFEGGPNGRGFGAWELAARISELNVDPTAFRVKFADRTTSAEAARAWLVGVNWYMMKNARLSFAFEQTHFQGGALVGNRPTEKVLLNRLQVSF